VRSTCAAPCGQADCCAEVGPPLESGSIAKVARIGTILGIDDAGEDHRKLSDTEEVEQRHGRRHCLGYVAAAKNLRIVEAVDEVDDQQRRDLSEARLLAELLLAIDIVSAHDGPMEMGFGSGGRC